MKRCAGCPAHLILIFDRTFGYGYLVGITTCKRGRRKRSTSIGDQQRRGHRNSHSRVLCHHSSLVQHNRGHPSLCRPSLCRHHARPALARLSRLRGWQTCRQRRRTTKPTLRGSASGYCSVYPFENLPVTSKIRVQDAWTFKTPGLSRPKDFQDTRTTAPSHLDAGEGL